jgi:meso-butanediol dehydrogenase/(S,S)-butanediol dehydrogenase/diacetyl reductase
MQSKKPSLENNVIAITGGGQGIGRAIALRLAMDGADLAIGDLNGANAESVCKEIRALGRTAIAIEMDVTRRADCERMVADVVQAFGRIDTMFCNAGIIQLKPFMEITEDDWDRIFAVNVRGVFLTLQAAARQMRAQAPMGPNRPKGKIVTTASMAGRYGAGPMAPFVPHYRASKAAVISLTQSTAWTFAPDITVNAICPGVVETDMWKQIDKQWNAIESWNEGEAWKRRVGTVPLGRAQTPEDVAGLAAYLASADSDYMTGQSINIDGGMAMN